METERVRLAVIGVGFMGEAHVSAIRANPRAELSAVCDRDASRLEEMRTRYGIPHVYTDFETLLESERLDGVVIATPDPHHRAPVEAAAAAGVHILLEKPIATTLPDAQAIMDVTETAGVKLLMGFTLRHDPAVIALRERVKAGEIGQPIDVYAKRQCRIAEGRRLGHRVSALAYLGVHDIDLVLWHLGTDIESVYATCGQFVLADLNTPDFYWTLLKWRNGATAAIHSTWVMPDAYPVYAEATHEFVGTRGAIMMEAPGNVFHVCNDGGCEKIAPGRATKLRDQITHFTRCILGEAEPIATTADGWNALAVVEAAEASARTGQPVPVSLMPS